MFGIYLHYQADSAMVFVLTHWTCCENEPFNWFNDIHDKKQDGIVTLTTRGVNNEVCKFRVSCEGTTWKCSRFYMKTMTYPMWAFMYWFGFGILRLSVKLVVEPSASIVLIILVLESDSGAPDKYGWFLYYYGTGSIINVWSLMTNTKRLLDGSEKIVGGGDISGTYVDNLPNCHLTLKLAKLTLEWYCRNGEDYFRIPSSEAQNSCLNLASLVWCVVTVPCARAVENFIGDV